MRKADRRYSLWCGHSIVVSCQKLRFLIGEIRMRKIQPSCSFVSLGYSNSDQINDFTSEPQSSQIRKIQDAVCHEMLTMVS